MERITKDWELERVIPSGLLVTEIFPFLSRLICRTREKKRPYGRMAMLLSSPIYFWQQFTTNLGKMMSFNNTENLMNSVRLKFHAYTGQQHTFLAPQKWVSKMWITMHKLAKLAISSLEKLQQGCWQSTARGTFSHYNNAQMHFDNFSLSLLY